VRAADGGGTDGKSGTEAGDRGGVVVSEVASGAGGGLKKPAGIPCIIHYLLFNIHYLLLFPGINYE